MSNEELFMAESLADELKTAGGWYRTALATFRYQTLCRKSPIQEYKCAVQTTHGYSCDTCLQDELHELWKAGVATVGSCCGHGVKPPYIQVMSKDVQKMHELGYKQMPLDESGNGEWCFMPKTYLPVLRPWQEADDE